MTWLCGLPQQSGWEEAGSLYTSPWAWPFQLWAHQETHDSPTQEQTNVTLSDLSSFTHSCESWELSWVPSGTKAESPAAALCCISHPFYPSVVVESATNRFLWTLASSAINLHSPNVAGSKVSGFRVQSAHTAWEKGNYTDSPLLD